MSEPDPATGPTDVPPGPSHPAPDDEPRMVAAAADVAALASVTTGGLPYPESVDPLNQGANNIKALALALESRGWGKRSEYRRMANVAFSGGIGRITFQTPFSVIPMVIWSPGWPFGSANLVLTAGLFGDYGSAGDPISKTGFQLLAYQVAPAAGWYTGPLDVYYLAVGAV